MSQSGAGTEVATIPTGAFLDELQERTFRWFWETTNPATGLVPDRYPSRTFSSIAAIGFGLPTYGIGVERGFVPRADAAERTLTTLRFLFNLRQGRQQTDTGGYKGFFYHFLEFDSGTRYRSVELSSIDTALLMAGVLFSREYFDGTDQVEQSIRAYADSLYQRVEWDWHRTENDRRMTMAWYPEVGFGKSIWQGYNEAMILYVLGLGSPTYPLEPEVWDAWTGTYEWAEFYGYPHINFEPLFGHQYSQLFVDFRGIQDDYLRRKSVELDERFDYFENSRRATLSQQAYAIDNPMGWRDYGANIWGLTASDGPANGDYEYNGEKRRFDTYRARGVSAQRIVDDGTISPTAVGGSIAFAPEVTIPALRAMIARYGDKLFAEYGFHDAFNPSFRAADATIKRHSRLTEQGWFDEEYLGIDQGPIIMMAENYRSELVWDKLRKSPYIVAGLRRAGFSGGWLDAVVTTAPRPLMLERQPEPTVVNPDRKLIVVLGSSVATGIGPRFSKNAWVNRYREWLTSIDPNFELLNLAAGGYTTYKIVPESEQQTKARPRADPMRNIDAALALNPAAIIISMSSDDTASGYSVEEQLRNFALLFDLSEAAGVPIWITSSLPRALNDQELQVQYQLKSALETRYKDRLIDFWNGFADSVGGQNPIFDSGDELHYNDAAHALFFERVQEAGIESTLRVSEPMNR